MKDAQERIIKQLLDAIESTQRLPWHRGFAQLLPSNLTTGERYHGQNVWSLAAAQLGRDFRLSRWVGFVQFQEWRAKHRDLWASDQPPIIRGKGTQVIKVSHGKERPLEHGSADDAEGTDTYTPLWLNTLTVFNADQIEGLKPDALKVVVNTTPLPEQMVTARNTLLGICQRLGVGVTFGEYRTPSYLPDRDVIYSPHEGLYVEQNDIVSHLAHELVHATGCRLGRKQSGDRRSKVYAEEELVAEMGAAMLLAHFGLDDERAIENSSAYVQGWATFIRSTPAAFVRAASNAQKAVDYIVAA